MGKGRSTDGLLGGLDYLRIRLGEDFKLTPYEGGVMIQAGPRPQIGDADANRWPQHYITLAKVLKPIQIKDHYPFHFGDSRGPARMDHAASLAWLFRFDGKQGTPSSPGEPTLCPRARPSLVRTLLTPPPRWRRIGHLPRESGSKQAGAAVASGACVPATRTPPPARRRT